jgi:hypothetical protein
MTVSALWWHGHYYNVYSTIPAFLSKPNTIHVVHFNIGNPNNFPLDKINYRRILRHNIIPGDRLFGLRHERSEITKKSEHQESNALHKLRPT